uniref:Uncharacterized protein n=1 Tax=viral metagenome TaxID=1070528 RepID=A0A6H2A1K6_9ZZZZ
MVEKHTRWTLSTVEKNGITDRIESILRSGDAREARLYNDLWSYIEDLINDAATQARSTKAREAEKSDD